MLSHQYPAIPTALRTSAGELLTRAATGGTFIPVIHIQRASKRPATSLALPAYKLPAPG